MNETPLQYDVRSTTELVSIVLTSNANVDFAYWDAIGALHRRGTPEVFEAARSLCESPCPLEQRIGCDILARLGGSDKPFASVSFPLVVSVLRKTENVDTLACAICALGWLGDLRGVDYVLPFLDHPDSEIRYWVLGALSALREDQRSMVGLIRLTTDSCVFVRDWATFELGTLIDEDTPEIREALFARVFDDDEVTRGEALVGLARRKDQRIIEPLIKELARYPDSEHGGYSLEAAEEIADARLLPVLARLKSADSDDTTFDDAIERCSWAKIVEK